MNIEKCQDSSRREERVRREIKTSLSLGKS
jgi:hypothetical protein